MPHDRGEADGAWGYSVTGSPDELRAAYEELLAAVHEVDAFAGFCYTQLTDTFQEANGLFTADREPKFELEAMRRATGVRGTTGGGAAEHDRPKGRRLPELRGRSCRPL